MSIEQAKALLTQEGYYANNLWHRYDVLQVADDEGVKNPHMTNAEADAILEGIMHGDYLMEVINDLIAIRVAEYIDKRNNSNN
jgi:hypothetical protein